VGAASPPGRSPLSEGVEPEAIGPTIEYRNEVSVGRASAWRGENGCPPESGRSEFQSMVGIEADHTSAAMYIKTL